MPSPAPAPAAADTQSFGLTATTTFYTVDTGAGLVFKIRRLDLGVSTQSPGDIASLVYRSVEYQDTSRGSHINGGFDYLYTDTSAVTVDAQQVDADHIKITVVAGELTHYYLARRGDSRIYMGTYFSREPNEDSQSFVRFIVRAQSARVPQGPAPSDLAGTQTTVESGDIFGLANGETRSKHYSNQRLRDWTHIGATGTQAGLWMVRGNSEGMSGGPFYRSLLNQHTSTNQEITYIVNYGMQQTEAYRTHLLNTYALVFTDGAAPADLGDMEWLGGMGLKGWMAAAQRGSVSAVAMTGMDRGRTYTVGFANATAQYWTTAAADGRFACTGMRPGTYNMTVYKDELAVATQSVNVTAGADTSVGALTIAQDPSAVAALWRIGDWDGSPAELLNGDKVTTMHPSDSRMAAWAPGPFVVGSASARAGFPAYQWKGVNGSQDVHFTLTAAQLRAYQVRIGITAAYASGRPRVAVNGWSPSALPAASPQPGSRSLTVGSYRGNNTTYTVNVPASALKVGTNVLTLSVISGSSGTGWLSPGYSVDAVDMVPL